MSKTKLPERKMCCATCQFFVLDERESQCLDAEVGHCIRMPPAAVPRAISAFPWVYGTSVCGEHNWSRAKH